MADKYIIRVTAGSTYDLDEHVDVPVNKAAPVKIDNDHMNIELNVRVQNYRGLPHGSPTTSPYFDHDPHAYNKDQYSIAFRFTPKKPKSAAGENTNKNNNIKEPTSKIEVNGTAGSSDDSGGEEQPEGISGMDLQFGNDFDHPIRDRLPPGFGTAMNIVRWWIDPGLEGDAYADMPYLYGPALSSFNAVHAGPGEHDEAKGGLWFVEGGDEHGRERRKALGAPEDPKARQKWALKPDSKQRWIWEYGRTYGVDFFNPYVDFSDFALRLPGFNLPIMKYWDGQGLRPNPKRSHQLRYVLRHRTTGHVYLVVLFTLHLKEDINEDGTLKPAAKEALAKASGGHGKKGAPLDDDSDKSKHDHFDEEKALDEARRKLSGVGLDEPGPETNDDDVD
ncbi:hypothetical protein B0H63DRAFT_472883 [Podospora didyma]|uniref:Domain of unknown function at the cortex 1 domain-containing protein n=1 Tax=Podospora didyma TaxID=330526 RepID=A0AAE0NPP0_9PEZI|nr:hypothetical protein B0H63DRAFT_472883 [Podospora didyma]